MSKIIHSMIRVLDLDRSLKFYADCFDLRPSHRLDFPSFSLVYLRNEHSDTESDPRATTRGQPIRDARTH